VHIWCRVKAAISRTKYQLGASKTAFDRRTLSSKPNFIPKDEIIPEGNVKGAAVGTLLSSLSHGVTRSIRSAHSHLLHHCKLSQRDEQLPGKLGEGAVSTIRSHSASIPGFRHPVWRVCPLLFAPLSIGVATIAAADPAIRIELNAAETVQQDHCRLSFVIENSVGSAIDTLKLDLALFDRGGTLNRRMIVEIGPLRAAKTIVRTFSVETDCGQIGSILLNDVTACTPGEPGGCLDRLALSSRPSTIRFFK
jgi:hypothetical protein